MYKTPFHKSGYIRRFSAHAYCHWLPDNWWAAVDGTDCTAEEMSKALEYSLGGSGNNVLDDDPSRVLVSNKVDL